MRNKKAKALRRTFRAVYFKRFGDYPTKGEIRTFRKQVARKQVTFNPTA